MLISPGFRLKANEVIYLNLLLIVLLLPFVAGAQSSDSLYSDTKQRDGILNNQATASCQRQIITGNQIRLSGFTRLSELVQLFDAFTFSSDIGDSWKLQANGLNSLYNFQGIIMLNGQKIQYGIYDVFVMNELGISVNDIERIELVNVPDLYLGEFADNGIIHIITRNRFNGLLYRGHVASGYDFSANRSDAKIVSQTLGYAFDRLSFQVSQNVYLNEYYHRTAPGIISRRTTLQATRIQLNYRGSRAEHQFQSILNPKGGLFNFNLIQARPAFLAGYLGRLDLKPGHAIRTSIRYATQNLTNPSNTGYALNANLFYQIRKPARWDNRQFKIGTEFSESRFSYFYIYAINGTLFDLELKTRSVKPYASITWPVKRKLWLTTDIQIALGTQATGYKAALTLYKRVSLISNWSLVAAYASRTAEENPSPFSFEQLIPANSGIYKGQTSNQLTGDANWALNVGSHFKLFLNNGLRFLYHQPGFLSDNGYEPNLGKLTYVHPNLTYRLQSLNWVARFNLHYDVWRDLLADFNYLHTRQLNGDAMMVAGIPRHKTTLILNYRLPAGFNLFTRLYYQSETEWSYYYAAKPLSTEKKLNSLLINDLSLSKTFFKQKLNMNLAVQNLFDAQEQYMPGGITKGVRAYFSLSWNLERLFASAGPKP